MDTNTTTVETFGPVQLSTPSWLTPEMYAQLYRERHHPSMAEVDMSGSPVRMGPSLKFPEIGTVIRATHRPQDLIPAFIECLRSDCQSPVFADVHESGIPSEAFDDDDHPWWTSEDCAYTLEDLDQLLNDYSPAYCYFGCHEGDGSDFGFWPSWDAIDEAVYDGDILKVDDLSEVPESGFTGHVLVTNDHGNVTLIHIKRPGQYVTHWSCPVSGF
jgi:hypothetical protein